MCSRSPTVGPSNAEPASSGQYVTALSSVDPIAPSSSAIPTSAEVTDFVSENNWNRRSGPANRPGYASCTSRPWCTTANPVVRVRACRSDSVLVAPSHSYVNSSGRGARGRTLGRPARGTVSVGSRSDMCANVHSFNGGRIISSS